MSQSTIAGTICEHCGRRGTNGWCKPGSAFRLCHDCRREYRKCKVKKQGSDLYYCWRGDHYLGSDCFNKARQTVTGLSSFCKPCQSNQRVLKYRENHATALLRVREQSMQRKYGITLAQRDGLVEAQGSRCAICDRPEADVVSSRLQVDHCHRTGRVRGMVCTICNQRIARVESVGNLTAEMLARINEYLK